MTETPTSLRIQIGIFGKTNCGKSSLFNALTNQEFSIVSNIAGTTTDPVKKSMEISGLGPVTFIDTAGFSDESELGNERIQKTKDTLFKSDIILALFAADDIKDAQDFNEILEFSKELKTECETEKKTIIPIITKIDLISQEELQNAQKIIESIFNKKTLPVSSKTKQGIPELIEKIKTATQKEEISFTKNLCKKGDTVLLVMPQDIQAPKGRLILPQVQILRELLDKKCIIFSCTHDMFEQTLKEIKNPPKLIIVDSQVFSAVNKLKPKKSKLTSFSILMAAAKGNIDLFIQGANALKNINNKTRILIAESCTHIPQEEDIGRVKIPKLLQKIAPDIKIDFVRGTDFPNALTDEKGNPLYDLIIHCGACMFNQQYMLHRQKLAQEAKIPMTNYGITIAALNKMLDKITIPA